MILVEIDDILMAILNEIIFERLNKDFDTLFIYAFQDETKLELCNTTSIQCENVIRIYQIDNIINNIIQEYRGIKTEE